MTIPVKEDEEFFGAIGRLTISWAHLELAIDTIVDIAYHALDGQSFEPEKPRALSRKITFLRSVFKSEAFSDHDVSNFLTLLDKIKHESDMRHDIIHGVVLERKERGGSVAMARTITKRRARTVKKYQVTPLSILKASRRAQKLATVTFKFGFRLRALICEPSQQCGERSH